MGSLNSKVELVKNIIFIVVLCLIIIGLLVDFISWKQALDFINQRVPISGPAYKLIQGYGYVPLVWRGNFSRIYLLDYRMPKYPLHDYIIIEFSGHNHIWVDLDGLGDGYYGNWTQTVAATKYIEEKQEGWEEIAQPFGTYCEVYVTVDFEKNTLFLVVVGEDRVFVRQFKCRRSGGSCGGGYTSYYWP